MSDTIVDIDKELRRMVDLVRKMNAAPLVMICCPLAEGEDSIRVICMQGIELEDAHEIMKKVLGLPTEVVVTGTEGDTLQ